MPEETNLPRSYEPSPVPKLVYSCQQHKDMFFWGGISFAVVVLLIVTAVLAIFQIWFSFVFTLPTILFLLTIFFLTTPKRLEVWSDSIKVDTFLFFKFPNSTC